MSKIKKFQFNIWFCLTNYMIKIFSKLSKVFEITGELCGSETTMSGREGTTMFSKHAHTVEILNKSRGNSESLKYNTTCAIGRVVDSIILLYTAVGLFSAMVLIVVSGPAQYACMRSIIYNASHYMSAVPSSTRMRCPRFRGTFTPTHA